MRYVTNTIEVNHERDYYSGKVHKSYRVIGGPKLFIHLHDIDEIDKEKGLLTVGPYKLVILEEFPFMMGYQAVLLDNRWHHFIIWSHHASRFLQSVKSRFIITMAVWGLAEITEATIPEWDDINFIRRIKRKVKHVCAI